MRVVKEAEERRNEILDVAEELFVTRGYDNTSTNDILERIGIARGTLYYHFKSKEDILNSIIERVNNSLIARARAIASDTSMPVVDRLVATIAGLRVDTDLGQEIIDQGHKAQNALMHQKMQKHLIESVVPVITGIVEEGKRQGIFNIRYPSETTEMLHLSGSRLSISRSSAPSAPPPSRDSLKNKMDFKNHSSAILNLCQMLKVN